MRHNITGAICLMMMAVVAKPVYAEAECQNEMHVHNKIQVITAGLMFKITDPNIRQITDYYGQEHKKADALVREGKYQEACDIYQAVIDKYGFKTMEQRYKENNPNQSANDQTTVTESTATSSATASKSAVSAGASSSAAD